MADLAAIRNALAATIQANTNPSLPCLGYAPPQINPPMAYVAPQPGQLIIFDTLDGGAQFMGAVTYHLRVVLVTAPVDNQSAQAAMDALLSTNEAGSVVNAIAQNARLGGAVDFAVTTTAHSYGLRLIGAEQYLACDLLVTVAASQP